MESDKSLIREEKVSRKDDNEEKSLIGEEDIHAEKAEDVFAMYQADEESGFHQREPNARQQGNGESVNETAAGKENCFKVDREAVNRVKEKPD